MNIELIRLKKKLAVMETEGSNQVFMDLLRLVKCPLISINERTINTLKISYQEEINRLQEKDLKYKQISLL